MAGEITYRNLANARFFVGEDFIRIRGMSSEGITISPVEDEGGVMTGTGGDSMVWQKPMSACIITINFLPASRGVTKLLELSLLGAPTKFKYQDGQLNLQGVYTIQNRGDITSTNTARVVTLACALITDTPVAVGDLVQAS